MEIDYWFIGGFIVLILIIIGLFAFTIFATRSFINEIRIILRQIEQIKETIEKIKHIEFSDKEKNIVTIA